MTETYDLIAIGGGPAGESATELASFFGLRCAIVERNRPGGTVTTTGGAPTKTLREAALFVSGSAMPTSTVCARRFRPKSRWTSFAREPGASVPQLQDLPKKNILARNVEYIEGEAHLDRRRRGLRFREGQAFATLARRSS